MNTVIAVARFEAAEETGMFRFFRGALLLQRIRLLRCPGSEHWHKPYCFTSREFVLYWCKISSAPYCLPLEGKVSLATDEVLLNLCRQANTLFNRISISVQTPSKLHITSKFEYRHTVSPRPRKYSSRSASYAIPASSQCCEPSSSITSFASAQ